MYLQSQRDHEFTSKKHASRRDFILQGTCKVRAAKDLSRSMAVTPSNEEAPT
jgi:hypothetical protein